jgi:hypothetical protein
LRKKVIWLGVAVFVVLAAWIGAWFWAADGIRSEIAALALNDGETDPRLTCDRLGVGGFPFRFDVTCEGATLISGDETVTAAGLKASALVYNLTHVILSAKAPVATENAFTGSASSLDFAALDGSIHLIPRDILQGLSGKGWRIGRVSLVADGLVWSDTVAEPFVEASADHFEAHLIDDAAKHDGKAGRAALDLYARLGNLVAPGYGIAGGDATLEAELTGLPDDVAVLAGDSEPLRHWQERGGVLTIARLKASAPEPATMLELSGAASLTDSGLIDMDLNYTSQNVFPRFAGVLPAYAIPLLEGAAQPDGTSKNTLRIADGRLKLLTFTLLDLPPLF